jgi:F0F1-type ATP synthase assembly protein I
MQRWYNRVSVKTLVAAQLLVTVAASLWIFGGAYGQWLAGATAPFWGIFLPFMVVVEFATGDTARPINQIMANLSIPVVALTVLIFLWFRGRVSALIGVPSLLGYNLLSMLGALLLYAAS